MGPKVSRIVCPDNTDKPSSESTCQGTLDHKKSCETELKFLAVPIGGDLKKLHNAPEFSALLGHHPYIQRGGQHYLSP
jgi:hypothetical protein